MKKFLIYIIGSIIFLSCKCAQKENVGEKIGAKPDKTLHAINNLINSQDNKGINIISTGPRGGSYTNPNGTEIRYTIFRIQVINDTIVPIDLEINFPEKPIPLLPDSTVLLGISLFPDSLTPDTIQDVLNFGVIGIEEFFETETTVASILKTSIKPKESYLFYIGIKYKSEIGNGTTRSILFINGQDIEAPFLPVKSIETDKINSRALQLVYGIGVDPPNYYRLIPCGQLKY